MKKTRKFPRPATRPSYREVFETAKELLAELEVKRGQVQVLLEELYKVKPDHKFFENKENIPRSIVKQVEETEPKKETGVHDEQEEQEIEPIATKQPEPEPTAQTV